MPTLTVTEILQETLGAFKKRVPAASYFSMTHTNARLKKGQSAIAHLRTLPTVGAYDAANGGYFANANEARSLLTDVPVTLDQHKHATVSLTHLNAISDGKIDIELGNCAYALGKAIVDHALGKVVAANITTSTTETIANTDRDTLGKVRKHLNSKGCMDERYGIVNSDFAEALYADPRIASRDYLGQDSAGEPYAVLRNVAGFREILEYPDLPTTGNMSAFFFDPRAVALVTALPEDSSALAASLGVPQIASSQVETDPDTGLSLLGIMHMQPGTQDLYLTMTVLFGASAGAQGGSAGAISDYAGHRVITA